MEGVLGQCYKKPVQKMEMENKQIYKGQLLKEKEDKAVLFLIILQNREKSIST